MNGYTLDSVRFETNAHIDRRTHEAAEERLARSLRGDAGRAGVPGLQRLLRSRPGWAARVVHPIAGASPRIA